MSKGETNDYLRSEYIRYALIESHLTLIEHSHFVMYNIHSYCLGTSLVLKAFTVILLTLMHSC